MKNSIRVHPLKPVHIENHKKVEKLLKGGLKEFKVCINDYCNATIYTLLGWGNEKSYLSLFSLGLNKKNKICFLEANFTRYIKEKRRRKEILKEKKGKIDAFFIDKTTLSKPITGIIEAKMVDNRIVYPWSGVDKVLNAFETAKKQLESVDPNHILDDVFLGTKMNTYRIVLLFTVISTRYADSGEGENLAYKSHKKIKETAKEHFDRIEAKLKWNYKKNLIHDSLIHTNDQMDSIKDYYDDEVWSKKDKKYIPRPFTHTYYPTGILVTVGLFR